jgi:hypothetical protein
MACDAFELSDETGIVGLPVAKEVGLCHTNGDQFEWGVSVLSATNEVNEILRARDAMCSAVNPDPSSEARTNLVIAYGGNWILFPATTNANTYASALGGSVKDYDCLSGFTFLQSEGD